MNAYILAEPDSLLENVEFSLWFDAKNQPAVSPDYFVKDIASGRYVKQDGTLRIQGDYMQVKLGGAGIDIPEPVQTTLLGNFPNPFNPSTAIRFDLAKSGVVSLDIYNLKGQKVKTLCADRLNAGSYEKTWNGTDENGKRVASGIYLYKLSTATKSFTKKMLMLK
jgi:hypothetical protein